MHVDVTAEIRDHVAETFERFLLTRALKQYRREREFERSVCDDDAMPMTDLGGEGGL